MHHQYIEIYVGLGGGGVVCQEFSWIPDGELDRLAEAKRVCPDYIWLWQNLKCPCPISNYWVVTKY